MIIVSGWGAPAARADEAARAGVFGSLEFRAAPLTPHAGWRRVVRQMSSDRPRFQRCRDDASQCIGSELKAWRRLVEMVAGAGKRDTLRAVNRYFNRWRYRDDRGSDGIADRWSGPAEFLARSGDCEEYATVKLFALRLLGYASHDLRIVAVQDTRRGAGHAVLAVPVGNDILILDNVTDRILSHRRLPHYVPRYSLSETARWAHIPAPRLPAHLRTRHAPPPPEEPPPARGA